MAANDYHRAVAHAWTDLGTWPIVHPDGLQALWRYTKPGEPPAYINPNDAWGKAEAKKLLKAARDLKDGKLLPPKRGIRLNHSLLKGDPSRIIPAILREGLRADPGGEGAHSESPGSLFFVADKFHSPNAAVITVDIPDGWEGWQGAVGAWYDWKSKRLTERPSPGSTVALAYSVPPEFVVAINGLPVAEYKKRVKASAARVASLFQEVRRASETSLWENAVADMAAFNKTYTNAMKGPSPARLKKVNRILGPYLWAKAVLPTYFQQTLLPAARSLSALTRDRDASEEDQRKGLERYKEVLQGALNQAGSPTFTYKGFRVSNPERLPDALTLRALGGIDYLRALFKKRGLDTALEAAVSHIRIVPEGPSGTFHAGTGELTLSTAESKPGRFGPSFIGETLIHEIGHAIHRVFITGEARQAWDQPWDELVREGLPETLAYGYPSQGDRERRDERLNPLQIVTDYGRTDKYEDFAETFLVFVVAPEKLSPVARYRIQRALSLSGLYGKPVARLAARVAARYRTAYKNVRELAKHADPAAIKFMADMEPYIFLRTSQTGNVLLETITRGVPPKGAAAQVEFSKGTVTLLRERWKMDPDTGIILRALQRIPEAKHLTVQAPRRNNLGTVDQLARKLRSVQITTPQEQDEDGGGYNMEDFTIEVLQELSDAKHIFHATRASHLPSIMKKGLVPSGTVDQGTGWTQYNFHLQNAVYLTLDYDYAVAIAKTLANRFGEEGVVLRVKGSAVSDYSKLVVDEDALENYVRGLGYNMGSIDPARPGFLQSVVDDIESFGYLGTIPPSALKVVRRVGSPSAARVAARYLARGV